MKNLQKKVDDTLSKINEIDLTRSKVISEQAESKSCSRQENEEIRFIFNTNKPVKNTFKNGIDSTLRRVFSEKYKDDGELVGGVYGIESEGRSVLNKLNTNYSCFCVLMKDINQMLLKQGVKEISLVGETPKIQLEETKRMVQIIDRLGERIFSPTSLTFKNLMSILTLTDRLGEEREIKTMNILKKKFGENNVLKIGGIGSRDDMIKGVDLIITYNNEKYSAQVKPMSTIQTNDDTITVLGSGGVKQYTTDWLVFTKKDQVYIFDNENTKIIDGNFTFDKKNLLYSL